MSQGKELLNTFTNAFASIYLGKLGAKIKEKKASAAIIKGLVEVADEIATKANMNEKERKALINKLVSTADLPDTNSVSDVHAIFAYSGEVEKDLEGEVGASLSFIPVGISIAGEIETQEKSAITMDIRETIRTSSTIGVDELRTETAEVIEKYLNAFDHGEDVIADSDTTVVIPSE